MSADRSRAVDLIETVLFQWHQGDDSCGCVRSALVLVLTPDEDGVVGCIDPASILPGLIECIGGVSHPLSELPAENLPAGVGRAAAAAGVDDATIRAATARATGEARGDSEPMRHSIQAGLKAGRVRAEQQP